jgi:hypothetical protein
VLVIAIVALARSFEALTTALRYFDLQAQAKRVDTNA